MPDPKSNTWLPPDQNFAYENENGDIVLSPETYRAMMQVLKNQASIGEQSENNRKEIGEQSEKNQKTSDVNRRKIKKHRGTIANLFFGSNRMTWKNYLHKYPYVTKKLSDSKFVRKHSDYRNFRQIDGCPNSLRRALNNRSNTVIVEVAKAMQIQYRRKFKFRAIVAIVIVILIAVSSFDKGETLVIKAVNSGRKQHLIIGAFSDFDNAQSLSVTVGGHIIKSLPYWRVCGCHSYKTGECESELYPPDAWYLLD